MNSRPMNSGGGLSSRVTALVLAPLLSYFNGPAVSRDQFVVRTLVVVLAALGAVGLASRRYLRRQRWSVDVESDYPEPIIPPPQEVAVEFRRLVDRATRELDVTKQRVLSGMALGLSRGSLPGLSARRVGRIREQIRGEWLRAI